MTDLPDDLFPEPTGPRPGAAPARKCKRHDWDTDYSAFPITILCMRCGKVKDPETSRRSRNNRSRGTRDELAVARILGGRKVGELGHPWDVEVPGYLRAQSKKLATWPSLREVIAWLDAIPVGAEMRAVTLADAPGPGGRTRRLIVLELAEFAERHGKGE